MSSGATHTKVAIAYAATTTIALAAGSSHQPVPGDIITSLVIGLIGQVVVTPDIDHHKFTVEEKRISDFFGRPVGWLWSLYWAPYEKMVPHRGISHIAFIGTLTRILYLSPLIVMGLYLLNYVPSVPQALAAYSTWAVGDLLHILFDTKLVKAIKGLVNHESQKRKISSTTKQGRAKRLHGSQRQSHVLQRRHSADARGNRRKSR